MVDLYINPEWPRAQLEKALRAARAASDPQERQRQADKARLWRQVLQGMRAGWLQPGSRTPQQGVPTWVTPQVLHGGFASGQWAAAGPWLPHERQWLQAHLDTAPAKGPADAEPDRAPLNDWFFATAAGQAQLNAWLDDGHWRLHAPEEGALLALAWLLRAGHADAAAQLLGELAPLVASPAFLSPPSGAGAARA